MAITKSWKERVIEILEDVGVFTALEWAKDAMKPHIEKHGSAIVGAVVTRTTSDNRAKAMAVIAAMASCGGSSMTNWQKIQNAGKILDENQRNRQACNPRSYGNQTPYVKGDEDRLIALCIGKLCEAFPETFKNDLVNLNGPAVTTLTWMAESHVLLDARLEGFINDFAGQKVGWLTDKIKKARDAARQSVDNQLIPGEQWLARSRAEETALMARRGYRV